MVLNCRIALCGLILGTVILSVTTFASAADVGEKRGELGIQLGYRWVDRQIVPDDSRGLGWVPGIQGAWALNDRCGMERYPAPQRDVVAELRTANTIGARVWGSALVPTGRKWNRYWGGSAAYRLPEEVSNDECGLSCRLGSGLRRSLLMAVPLG